MVLFIENNVYLRPPCASPTRDFLLQEVAQLIMVVHICMEEFRPKWGYFGAEKNVCPPETRIQILYLTNFPPALSAGGK